MYARFQTLAVATLVDARMALVSLSTSTTPNTAPVMLPACQVFTRKGEEDT